MSVHVVVSLPTLTSFSFELLVFTFLILAVKFGLLRADLVSEMSLIVPPGRTLNAREVSNVSKLTVELKLAPHSTTAAASGVNSVNNGSC